MAGAAALVERGRRGHVVCPGREAAPVAGVREGLLRLPLLLPPLAPPTFSEPNLRNGAWGARPWRTRTPFSPARCASCRRVLERPSPRPAAADSCRSVAVLGPLEQVSFPAPSCRSADSAPRPLKGWGPCCARSAASRRPSRSRLRGANPRYSRRGLLQSLRGRAYSLFLRYSATDRPRLQPRSDRVASNGVPACNLLSTLRNWHYGARFR